MKLEKLRKNYTQKTLSISNVENHPIDEFKKWFKSVQKTSTPEPNAMTLSTLGKDNAPSSRVVLLKEVSDKGFIFYTNYKSQKAKEIKANKNVALNFAWIDAEQQVRISGTAKKISKKDSLAYFQSRPKGSQIGAHASNQSEVIKSRKVLNKKLKELTNKYENVDSIPLPKNWGGYVIIPTVVEFWQGRSNRLHDRIRYTKTNKGWKIERLAP